MATAIAAGAAAVLPMRHRALRGLSLAVGSLVFGASRDACQHLVRFATDRHWVEYATAIDDDGSVLFGTLLNDRTYLVGAPTVAPLSEVREPGGTAPADVWFVVDEAHRQAGAATDRWAALRSLAVAGSRPLAR